MIAHAADPAVRARAAVTAGSALRQTGRHAEARDLESAALRTAPPRDRAQLLIGLAADAVGLGDATRCARRLASAAEALPARDWRARVRLDWVRCEHALLRGDARAAVRFARAALRRSRRAGALRHEAKSLLFLAVALREAGLPGDHDALRDGARIAAAIGARPVRDVARDLLAGRTGRDG